MTTQGIRKIWTPDFVLCFLAQFCFAAVFHMLIPTLPIYLSRLGSSEAEIGVLIGILGISSLAIRPFVGKELLKIAEKKFMTSGSLIFALTSIAYPLASPFVPFLIVRLIQGIGLAFFRTASLTFVANTSQEGHRGQTLSYFYLAINISFALSPAFGMFLINTFGSTLLFVFCLALSLCALFFSARLTKRQIAPSDDLSNQREGWFIHRRTFPTALVGFLNHIIWGAATAFFPLYAVAKGMTNPGFFFAAFAIMVILGRAFGGKILDIFDRRKLIVSCLMAYFISMVILAFFKTPLMFILAAVIWGTGHSFLTPSLLAHVFEHSDVARGPAVGTFTAFVDLGVALGPVIMGLIVRWTSYPTMFLCLALIGLINLNYFLFSFKEKGTSVK